MWGHLAYLRTKILDRDLHILIRIFLFKEGVQGLVHVDEEFAGAACLIYKAGSDRTTHESSYRAYLDFLA